MPSFFKIYSKIKIILLNIPITKNTTNGEKSIGSDLKTSLLNKKFLIGVNIGSVSEIIISKNLFDFPVNITTKEIIILPIKSSSITLIKAFIVKYKTPIILEEHTAIFYIVHTLSSNFGVAWSN